MNARALQVRTLTTESFEQWDAFVDESPQGDVFCCSWWLNAITKGEFKILAVVEGNDIVAGIPLAYIRGRVNEPLLTRTLGPLFRALGDLPEHKQVTLQRRWLGALLDELPLDSVEQFCTSHRFTDWLPFRWKGFKQMTRYTYLIDYEGLSQEGLWRLVNRGHQRMVRKARRSGVRIRTTDSPEQFYELMCMTYKRQGLTFRLPYNVFERLDNVIASRDRRRIITAFDEDGRAHAAIYIAHSPKAAYALLSAADPQFRSTGAQTLVMWEAMAHFRDKVPCFNFGGSDIERIEQHLRGYGGTLTPYFHIFTEKTAPPNDRGAPKLQAPRPMFSVITPTNKRPRLLRRAIESVLAQSFADWEQIVVDDANDPDAARLVAEVNDPRVSYVAHDSPKGAAGAYNTGIGLARGQHINFLDDDDEYLPGMLEKMAQAFRDADNQPGFIWTGITSVRDTDDGEESIRTQVWPARFQTREAGLAAATAIGNGFGLSVKRECIDEIGTYDESLRVGEDTDFLMRLSQKYHFCTIPEVLVKIHHHGSTQLTHEDNVKEKYKCYRVIISKNFEFLSEHWSAFYVHNRTYIGLCFSINERVAGLKALAAMIRRYPGKRRVYADLLCYTLFGVDYQSWSRSRRKKGASGGG